MKKMYLVKVSSVNINDFLLNDPNIYVLIHLADSYSMCCKVSQDQIKPGS